MGGAVGRSYTMTYRAYVDFSQGLDIRLITPDNVALLNKVRKLRVQAVVRAAMLHSVRQVRSRTVARAATDKPVSGW